ncbi:MAG: hypothetical protein K9K66_09075 [Desulfarculaceae bacterium]|nr:hypothetical protein [Desulfarculaceae bacterium]MCF8073117.1 hypothetical protein [Desulfarculaceae bacterium]MCF8101798.1 hypothetical protein [Desulfarculaceae bacterium]MCF8117362.1 hypothetical protein [Desulfarculaceae bacterium]
MRALIVLLAVGLVLVLTAGAAQAYNTTLRVEVVNKLFGSMQGPVDVDITGDPDHKVSDSVERGTPGKYVLPQPAWLAKLTNYSYKITVRAHGDEFKSVVCNVDMTNIFSVGPQITDFHVSTTAISRKVYSTVNSDNYGTYGTVNIIISNIDPGK